MNLKQRMFLKPLFLAGLIMAAFSVGPSTDASGQSDSVQAKLDENLKKWSSIKKTNYEYTFQLTCYCAQEITRPVRISVLEGEVEEVEYTGSGQQADITKFEYYLKTERLFKIIQDAIDRKAQRIDVSYHSEFGYPKSVYIDYKKSMIDDEIRFEVEDLVISK